jgi:hypothetical protein
MRTPPSPCSISGRKKKKKKKGQKNGALRETRKMSSLFLERLLSKTMITLFRPLIYPHYWVLLPDPGFLSL